MKELSVFLVSGCDGERAALIDSDELPTTWVVGWERGSRDADSLGDAPAPPTGQSVSGWTPRTAPPLHPAMISQQKSNELVEPSCVDVTLCSVTGLSFSYKKNIRLETRMRESIDVEAAVIRLYRE